MQNSLFYGSGTALVTPFHGNRIDFDALENLIDFQIDAGTDALIVLGTTGEPPTLSESERCAVIECAAARIARRVPMIVGVGSNDTRRVIQRTVQAQTMGADALLVVTPYYNRTSRQGLIDHYTAIADRSQIPIVMYNVPARTGMNMAPEIAAELAKHPMLRALKDACSDTRHMTEMARLCGEGLALYTGCDDCVLQALALGAHGVISVAGNVIPAEMHAMASCRMNGEADKCRNLQFEWMPLIRCLSAEVNPIPVKAALAMMGRIEENLRLPLRPLSGEVRHALRQELKKKGLIES